LKQCEASVEVFVPKGDDGYGITEEIVNRFNEIGCDLIITVDNGITAFKAVDRAAQLNIDVIITDHHTPEEQLPNAVAVINPKSDEKYPFKDLAGAGVAYKLIFGLFFSYTKYFNKEVVVLDLETTGFDTDDEIIEIGAIKLKNLIKIDEFHEYVKPHKPIKDEIKEITGITDEKLYSARPVSFVIKDFYKFINDSILVGHNIDGFDMPFIKRDIKKHLKKSIKNETVDTLTLSREHLNLPSNKLIHVAEFFNIKIPGEYHSAYYDAQVTVEIFRRFYKITKKVKKILEMFSEYAVLGTLADVVTLTDENRLIVKKGMEQLKKTNIIGLDLLIKKLNIEKKNINSKTMAWKIVPLLNAPGRMGMAQKSLQLLITDNRKEAQEVVDELLVINQKRKDKQQLNFDKVMSILEEKVDVEHDKIFIIDIKDMEHGVTGVIANRIKDMYYRPVVILILKDGEGIGTARSIEQFKIYEAFKQCEDLFMDFGGHKYAVGFSLKEEKLEEFKKRLKGIADETLQLEDLVPVLEIDAEIEPDILTIKLLRKIDEIFSPYGEDNNEPLLLMRSLQLLNFQPIGVDKRHLKLRVGTGDNLSFDALWWGGMEKEFDFKMGNHYDIVFRPEINVWNNRESISLIVEAIRLSE
ncbi:MAG: single-stranded-DNA-specific exonuclease RecJ, partial [Spirochaetes bacterium]|nr:single-stranded-DNA-specific exonuclease RecJ [Spirochaetota bacterium]